MTSLLRIGRIPGISRVPGSDVIYQEVALGIPPRISCSPDTKSKNWVSIEKLDFVSGEHDMRGGIPSATSWKMTSFPGILEIPGILAILGSDVIFQEIPVFRTHSSVNLDFSDFVSGEHDMRGGIPSATSWKMTSFPRILEIPGILPILRSDVIFREVPVFRFFDRDSNFWTLY
ncbi:unnamed protein product [Xylocopa violacea]|uniref:Uncharacterized protein n=1 Tax=Xylocopa violacea TaxID=135666 RepID=A0ABP1N782_XYLVO